VNSTTQLSNASAGGVWSSSNEGIAIVNSTTGLVTGVTAGSASISYVVTNASGCSATAITNITVNALPVQPTVTAGGSTVFCAGSSVVLTSSAGTSYQWYKNGTAIVGATAVSYTATTSGTYSVSVGNSNGCMSVASTGTPVTMNDLPSTPVISAGGPTTFCAGGSVVLSSSVASGNQWYLNGAIINAATDQQIKVEHSGSYTVVNIVNGCSSLVSNTIVVTENSLPTAPVITAAGPITFCLGNSVLLTSSTGSTYQWLKDGKGIVGQTNKTLTVTTGGSYQVSIKDANGCSNLLLSNKIAVTVNEIPVKPEIFTNRPTSFCNGDSSILQSSAAIGNQWYKDGIAIIGATTQNLKVKVAGLYTVKVTNESGCLSTVSEGINITVTNLPVTPVITVVGSTNICKGDSVFLKSSASSGNEWYLNNELIPGATSTGIYASKSGSYSVIETNIFGCNSAPANSKQVIVNALPDTPLIATSGKTTFCAGGSVVLSSSAGNAYQWLRNGIDIVGANSQTYTATATGLYSVSVANLAGCKKSSATVIPVNAVPLPVGNIIGSTIQFICTNGSQTLEAIGGASYKWFKDAVLIPGNTTSKLVASLPGLYSVSVLNEFGCETKATKTVQILQIQKPKADYVYDIYCTNKIVNFQSTSNVSGSGPVNYVWTDGNVISKFSSSSPSFVFKNPGTYNIKLVVTPYFCPGSADSITKSVKIEDPVAGIRMSAVDVAVNDLVQLQARNIGTNYLWSPATYLSSATIANPTIQTSAQQEYRIKIDQLSGCTTTDTLLVRIHNANRIYIPTVFSPNDDGLNDKLYLNYVGIRQLKVHRIYNRWGKMMYETTNMNEGWDGTVFGVKQPMDSYTVIVEAIDKNGNLIRSQGTITLLR
jgi:gliding motility-associated-like protein